MQTPGFKDRKGNASPMTANNPATSFGDLLISDDLYKEQSYNQLYNEFIKIKKERQTYKLLQSKGSFSQVEQARFIDKYVKIIERNEKSIEKRLLALTDAHIDRIEEVDPDMMTQE